MTGDGTCLRAQRELARCDVSDTCRAVAHMLACPVGQRATEYEDRLARLEAEREQPTVHDHRCSDACAASEEHMRAMEADADRQVAEAEAPVSAYLVEGDPSEQPEEVHAVTELALPPAIRRWVDYLEESSHEPPTGPVWTTYGDLRSLVAEVVDVFGRKPLDLGKAAE